MPRSLRGLRPSLSVVSTEAHPFYGEEYVALAITTTPIDAAIPLTADDWSIGELPKDSYVKPWLPAVLKEEAIRSVAGAVTPTLLERVGESFATICGFE